MNMFDGKCIFKKTTCEVPDQYRGSSEVKKKLWCKLVFETNGLKGLCFQSVETRALSTRGQADINLHRLDERAVSLYIRVASIFEYFFYLLP